MSLALILLILAGCGGLPARGTPTLAPFRPAPPLPATPTPLTNPADLVLPLSTPVCLDNLTFLSDVTIPDGTEVEPNSTLDKRWEVQNSGNCNWDERYRLRLIAGPAMQAAEEQALFPARSGNKAIIQVVFQAPAEPGQYRSAWQAYNAEGQPFGDVIFIDIVVK
ncbi:hypothetical protein ANT_01530 [Anaerolinea thermophila UNI-1]|uniref:Nbr1 FW domain-containing protein n=2 Tax=Anaerolinea thermophila TaxID=167964 RepID=E8MZ44_ANATU|nr:hypothetical protein ANT_01530 [Anaerolinea thermophila UNI-1]